METLRESEPPSGDLAGILLRRRQTLLAEFRKLTEAQGKYLFEGRLLVPEEIREYHRFLEKRDKVMFAEILLLFVFMLVIPAALGVVLAILCF